MTDDNTPQTQSSSARSTPASTSSDINAEVASNSNTQDGGAQRRGRLPGQQGFSSKHDFAAEAYKYYLDTANEVPKELVAHPPKTWTKDETKWLVIDTLLKHKHQIRAKEWAELARMMFKESVDRKDNKFKPRTSCAISAYVFRVGNIEGLNDFIKYGKPKPLSNEEKTDLIYIWPHLVTLNKFPELSKEMSLAAEDPEKKHVFHKRTPSQLWRLLGTGSSPKSVNGWFTLGKEAKEKEFRRRMEEDLEYNEGMDNDGDDDEI